MPNKKMLDSMKQKKENQIISWEAPEFIYYKKNTSWYIMLIVIGLALIGAFYFMDNLLAIGVVVFAIVVIFIISKQKPKNRLCKLSKDTITIENKSYPIADFKSFFITYTQEIPVLHFERTKKISTPINMLLVNIEEKKVVDFLKLFLPENQNPTLPMSDTFSNWFKF